MARQGARPARDFIELPAADERKILPALREFPGGAPRSSLPAVILKLSALPSDMQAVAEAVVALAVERHVSWTILMRGIGVIYLSLGASDASAESVDRLHNAAAAMAARCDGRQLRSATFLWRSREIGSATNTWAPVRDDLPLLHHVKNTFDPARIFAPGRFVGGI
jgi:hypothetical protein